MAGENEDIVVLINWRKNPIDVLDIYFPGKPNITSVTSLRGAGHFQGHLHEQQRGVLELQEGDGGAHVRTRLEVVDFLLVD